MSQDLVVKSATVNEAFAIGGTRATRDETLELSSVEERMSTEKQPHQVEDKPAPSWKRTAKTVVML